MCRCVKKGVKVWVCCCKQQNETTAKRRMNSLIPEESIRLEHEAERKSAVEKRISRDPRYFTISIHGGFKAFPADDVSEQTLEQIDVDPVIQELLRDSKYVSVSFDEVMTWVRN